MTRVLILGGTTEAGLLARAVAEAGIPAIYSYAGRTASPVRQPLATRVGGFGGPQGLADFLRAEAITAVVDATHPFAARMSANAVAACAATGVPLAAFEREPWRPRPGDDWRRVPDIDAAVAALAGEPARVFLALGRLHLAAFAAAPQHDYLLRLVDAPTTPLPLPNARAVIARGPFTIEDDISLLRSHAIELVVAKNAGGVGASAKLDAARHLSLPVILIDRPYVPERLVLRSLAEVMAWLGHDVPPETLRGV
ncbi:MAG: cobalt-precorrin-6A reductase [Rhizobiales bacterium]|nr:cobalt-precorrin-6A reductase [Hyphomicrobiales bacterium]